MEPETRMNAREYFQQKFHPRTERIQQSFDWSKIRLDMQASGHSQDDIEKTYRELVGFEGRFSNDYPIEYAISELIGSMPCSVSKKNSGMLLRQG